jgi:hypothetical protein
MNIENEKEEPSDLHGDGFRIKAGTRLAMRKSDWLGNWYVSESPRNCNNNAEGPWEEWVTLARLILAEDEKLKASKGQPV